MNVFAAQEENDTQDMPVPVHVAIIMDGNGRWASDRNLPRAAGHKSGAETVREVVKGCRELGIRYLTLYAFSSENWKRPAREINDLMGLFRLYLGKELEELHGNNIRVRFIGKRQALPADLIDMINGAEELTAANTALNLIVAMNYGSHDEIVGAARKIAEDVAAGRIATEDITPERFSTYLETSDVPDPDLVIRTSGEKRLSNFLLWQAAYAELVFVDTFWPDFTKQELVAAIREYQGRQRRYGASRV